MEQHEYRKQWEKAIKIFRKHKQTNMQKTSSANMKKIKHGMILGEGTVNKKDFI